MRAHVRSSAVAGLAIAGAGALAITPLAAPPTVQAPPSVIHEVRLAAATPPLGAIPFGFLRNQVQYCGIICPSVVQGAVTVPVGAALAPVAFLQSLQGGGSLLASIGAAAASATVPANTAAEAIIYDDLNLVLPKAQHALQVAVVQGIDVAGAVLTPGSLLDAVGNARTQIVGALNQPVGPPTTPTGATNILQVGAVEGINVASAVLFQAGELLLLGLVQVPNAATVELAATGDPVSAVAAGLSQTRDVVQDAGGKIVDAVHTAGTNIHESLQDPFPGVSTARESNRPALNVVRSAPTQSGPTTTVGTSRSERRLLKPVSTAPSGSGPVRKVVGNLQRAVSDISDSLRKPFSDKTSDNTSDGKADSADSDS